MGTRLEKLVDVKAGSEGKESFRRPLRTSRETCTASQIFLLACVDVVLAHLILRCPVSVAIDLMPSVRSAIVWLRLCRVTMAEGLTSSALDVSPLFGPSAREHSVTCSHLLLQPLLAE